MPLGLSVRSLILCPLLCAGALHLRCHRQNSLISKIVLTPISPTSDINLRLVTLCSLFSICVYFDYPSGATAAPHLTELCLDVVGVWLELVAIENFRKISFPFPSALSSNVAPLSLLRPHL